MERTCGPLPILMCLGASFTLDDLPDAGGPANRCFAVETGARAMGFGRHAHLLPGRTTNDNFPFARLLFA